MHSLRETDHAKYLLFEMQGIRVRGSFFYRNSRKVYRMQFIFTCSCKPIAGIHGIFLHSLIKLEVSFLIRYSATPDYWPSWFNNFREQSTNLLSVVKSNFGPFQFTTCQ